MPGISSTTDSSYNYYKERVNDLEEEMSAARKSAEKARKKELASLEERQKEVLERKDRETEETIRNIRENSAESLERERANAKRDREELLRTTYNKVGRYGGLDPLALKEQVRGLKHENDLRESERKQQAKLTEEQYHRKLDEAEQRHNSRLERTAEEIKDATASSYSKIYRQQNEENSKLKSDAEEKYQELVRQLNQERVESQRRLANIVDEYERKEKNSVKGQSRSTDKLEEVYRKKLEDTVRTANQTAAEAHHRSDLKMRQMQDHLALYGKESGQGIADALARYESENKARLNQIQEMHGKEIDKLQESNEAALRHNEASHAETMRDKDLYISNLTRRMSDEAHRERQELSDTHERATNHARKQHEHDKEIAQRSHENQLKLQNEQHASSMEEQSKAFRRTLARNHESYSVEMNRMQDQLQQQRTTSDPKEISANAYETIRRDLGREFDKTLGAERERNDRALEFSRDEYRQRFAELRNDKERTVTQLQTERAMERHLDRKTLLGQMEESEFQKNEALRKKDFETHRETNNLSRNYASAMEKQRMGYDEAFELQRNNAAFKIATQRQDAEFNLRRAQREFAARENELIREHESKLMRQKNELTAKIEEVKLEGQVAVRQAEQRAKQHLEEQARAYEQKIARMEEQHKEHERYLKDNFNEQLERMKRSYALHNKKKG